MGFVLYCFPSCSLYSSHAGFLEIPWSLQVSSHLGAFSFTVLSFSQCSYPRNPQILFPHFLQDSAQMPPFQKSFPWPSYLKDYSFFSFSMPLTCFIYLIYIYLFPVSEPFIMVVWIIFFNSAQAVTMWLCKASYYSDMYFSALLDIACGMLWLVGCKQRWPWQSWVEDLKDFYSPFFYFCHPPWEENASGRWFVPEWWRHVMGNWTWPEASPSQTLANQVKISQTSSDLQTCTWKE